MMRETTKTREQSQTEAPRKATRNEWLGLAVLGMASLVVAIDLFVMLLALPKISQDLHTSGTQLLWITDMYGFLLAGFLITMGTLGDHIGRRKVLLFGSAAFGATSLLVAFSQSAEMLIFARALLGVAGAMIAPAALSLIRHMFVDRAENARAISIWLSCLIGESIVGPLVGGVLLEHFLCLTTVGGGLVALLIGFALFNLGSGPLVTLGTGIVIGSVAPQKAGAAAAVSQTGNEFGFALGVAVVGSIGAFVYRMQTTTLPHELSADAAHAVQETLATAVSTAGNLPGKLGSDVLSIARNAFVQEYHTVALLSAGVLTIIAVVIVVMLKGLPAMAEENEG